MQKCIFCSLRLVLMTFRLMDPATASFPPPNRMQAAPKSTAIQAVFLEKALSLLGRVEPSALNAHPTLWLDCTTSRLIRSPRRPPAEYIAQSLLPLEVSRRRGMRDLSHESALMELKDGIIFTKLAGQDLFRLAGSATQPLGFHRIRLRHIGYARMDGKISELTLSDLSNGGLPLGAAFTAKVDPQNSDVLEIIPEHMNGMVLGPDLAFTTLSRLGPLGDKHSANNTEFQMSSLLSEMSISLAADESGEKAFLDRLSRLSRSQLVVRFGDFKYPERTLFPGEKDAGDEDRIVIQLHSALLLPGQKAMLKLAVLKAVTNIMAPQRGEQNTLSPFITAASEEFGREAMIAAFETFMPGAVTIVRLLRNIAAGGPLQELVDEFVAGLPEGMIGLNLMPVDLGGGQPTVGPQPSRRIMIFRGAAATAGAPILRLLTKRSNTETIRDLPENPVPAPAAQKVTGAVLTSAHPDAQTPKPLMKPLGWLALRSESWGSAQELLGVGTIFIFLLLDAWRQYRASQIAAFPHTGPAEASPGNASPPESSHSSLILHGFTPEQSARIRSVFERVLQAAVVENRKLRKVQWSLRQLPNGVIELSSDRQDARSVTEASFGENLMALDFASAISERILKEPRDYDGSYSVTIERAAMILTARAGFNVEHLLRSWIEDSEGRETDPYVGMAEELLQVSDWSQVDIFPDRSPLANLRSLLKRLRLRGRFLAGLLIGAHAIGPLSRSMDQQRDGAA